MKISVIVPVYNKFKYLEKLLGMIATQTFQDYECILIDDGSTDGSELVCDSICKKDYRFIVRHIPNGGVSHARNVGLDLATGEYITFIDADDQISPCYLENLYHCINDNSVDLAMSWIARLTANGEVLQKEVPLKTGKYQMEDILPVFCKIQKDSGIFGWCVAKIFKRELIDNIRFSEEFRLAEDFDFYLKIYPHINEFYFDEKSYYFYLEEAENSSVLINDEDIDYLSQLRINLRYRNFLMDVGGWSGDNKKIVEQLLSNYAYFVIFHSPIEDFEERFAMVNEIWQRERLKSYPTGISQRVLLHMLRKNRKQQAKNTMIIYRYLRRIVRRHE